MSKVSVIIPTYNRAKYLTETIDSVLQQTYQNFEIIIIDDGSIDSTSDLIAGRIKKYPGKIRYFYQSNNGPAAARNRGIREARGEYISFLDSDDLWLPAMLEKSINFIVKYNFDWVCTASFRLMSVNGRLEKRYMDSEFLDYSGKQIKLLKNGIFFFSSVPIYTGTILLEKECFSKAGMFNESYKIAEDWDMWLRLEEDHLKGGYLDEHLFIYRIHSGSTMVRGRLTGLKHHLYLAKKHVKFLGIRKLIIRKSYSDFLWKSATIFFTNKNYLSGIIYLVKSMCIYIDIERFRKINRFIKKRI